MLRWCELATEPPCPLTAAGALPLTDGRSFDDATAGAPAPAAAATRGRLVDVLVVFEDATLGAPAAPATLIVMSLPNTCAQTMVMASH